MRKNILTLTLLALSGSCLIVEAADFTVPGTNATINDAIVDSNAAGGSNTLTIGADQIMSGVMPNIIANLAISSDAGNTRTINLNSVLNLGLRFQTGAYSISDLIIINGSATSASTGGAITNLGTLTINNAQLNSNIANTTSGGTIYNTGSGTTVNIDNTEFNQNQAMGTALNNGGGAIYNIAGGIVNIGQTAGNVAFNGNTAYRGGAIFNTGSGSTLNINNAEFNQNQALAATSGHGGAIYNANAGSLVINDTIFDQNRTTGASAFGGAIYNATGGTVSINGTTIFTENASIANGGAIYNTDANSTVTIGGNATFTGNSATNNGGAIFNNANGILNVDGATFTNNTASANAGAIYNFNGATANIDNTTFTGNTSNSNGGAIFNGVNTNLNIGNNTVFDSNRANNGGAIYNTTTATVTINDDATFTGNSANNQGGAIYNSATINLNSAAGGITFTGNTAVNGGAIYNTGTGTASITGNAFTNNTATGSGSTSGGGAIFNVAGGQIAITDSTFTSNTAATGRGGAIHNSGASSTTTINSGTTFDTNSASYGGAIYNDTGTVEIGSDAVFNNNSATVAFGGAIYNSAGALRIGSDAVFNSNSASNGGAIFNSVGTTEIGPGAVFSDNSATTGSGGAIYNLTGTFDIDADAAFTNNSAASGNGGAIFNSATLNLNTASGNAVFTNNTAGGVANDIHNTNTINISGTGVVSLEGGVSGTVAGMINQDSSGEIILGVNSINDNYLGTYDQTAGTTTVLGNSFFGGTNNISDSNLNLFTVSPVMNINNLNLTNANVNSINNVINTFNIANFSANGISNFYIDIDGLAEISDQFILGITTGTGTINVANFNILSAPTAEIIDLPVFTGDVSSLTFTSSQTEVITPIYRYFVESLDPSQKGVYRLFRLTNSSPEAFNSQVFRGQVATMSAYYNQLVVNNVLFDHVYLDSELYGAFIENPNRYAQSGPIFAPYQYRTDEGSIWCKNYFTVERLFMTQNLDVDNRAYGSIIGADFPVKKLGEGWKFLPTVFVAYNGGHQTFNRVSMYQNGGQGGFLGTFNKGGFIASVLSYGGGYHNEMSLQGVTDRTGNWFAGTAMKAAYNYRASRHWIIQPTSLISYNIFGNQHWGSDFGGISMVAGYLNGINIAPGLNFIYGRENWSAYVTTQYIYNINDKLNGSAGEVRLPNVMMRHGYFEIGCGLVKKIGDRFLAYGQAVLREGGRRGVGFQLGVTWRL